LPATLFAEHGYSHVSLESICTSAGVTRGAAYHHFKNKKDIFRAVFHKQLQEIARRIEERASQEEDPWQQLVEGCMTYLEITTDPKLLQIVMVDAPAVLSWSEYQKIDTHDSDSGFLLLEEILTILRDRKLIEDLPVPMLAHQLAGAMDQAVKVIANAEEQSTALNEAKDVLRVLLSSLKV
jgi:AcrR family transcriptional regulator